MNAYGWLKFLHVLSVIIWIGGITALAVVTWRVAREKNRPALAPLLQQATIYGQRIVGPASGIVLLSGLAMVGMAHIGFATFWVLWGYGGIVVHGVAGGVFLRKRTAELAQIASASAGDDAALISAGRRLWMTQLVYLLILAGVIAVMILKPTL